VDALSTFDPTNDGQRAAAAALRERLVALGFGPGSAALFGVDDYASVRADRSDYYDAFVLPRDAAGRAARFFVLHRPESDAALREWLGNEHVAFLDALGLIVPAGEQRRALASATWFAGRLIFADARAYNAVWPGDPFPEYVMPPGGDSLGLAHVAPPVQRHLTLDLCCGPGTQALAAAAHSERVVGVDLNPRALRFARFNAAVNGVANAVFVAGDAYAPLDVEPAGAILANPPFVPWPPGDPDLLYRGGGPRGDDVLARIFGGAVARLEPNGFLTVVADLADIDGLPERLRAWQGVARRTLILLQHRIDLLAYAELHAAHHDDRARRQAGVVRLLTHFQAAGIATLDFGYVIQDGEPGPVLIERTAGPFTAATGADVAAWFAHQRLLAAPGAADREAALAPGVRLVEVGERDAAGATSSACYVAPGAGSVHEARPVSRTAFALLMRATAGGLRARDVTEPAAARELQALLARGLLRLLGERPSGESGVR
jgi:carbamoyltransferase